MADFESEAKHKSSTKKKRRLRIAEGERDEQRPSKAPRMDRSEKEKKRKKPKEVAAEHTEPIQKIEDDPPWRNLQLMLSLQNKDIDLPKKVELAYGYMKLRVSEEGDGSTEGLEVVSISRVMVFLNNWVQSLLISSEKKIRAEGYKIQTEIVGSCLDYRCWEIFKYCLEESLKLHVSLSFSRDFLRVIHCIARDALSRLNGVSSHSKEMVLNGENLDLYSIVIGCVSLVFSSHGGVSNENLDLWILTADSVFELVQKNFDSILDGGKKDVFVLQFSCVVIEPFAKFLRIHPTRKNGFRDFIDKLLKPLLHLLDALHLYVHRSDSDWIRNLLKFIEEVVSHGLFHPAHMDGFLSLQSTGKYMTFEDGKPRDLNIIIKSYHRLLFDKLEMVLAGKSVLALRGVGELFRLFVNCVKNQKAASVRGGLRHLENDWPKISSENINVASEKSNCSSLHAETRKSLFDFFVQIMEPFLQELNVYLQAELEVGPVLFHVHNTLSCINKIILSFMHEKLYLRTEDTSEGAFFNFLKVVYDMVLSFFTKFMRLWQSPLDLDSINKMGMLNSVAKELVLAASHLIEIEYEVVGNDLERLWLMMFKFVALGLSLPDAPGQHSLSSEILHLGCQLVNLYSELRQVDNALFALCKALRRLVLPESWGEMISSTYTSSAPSVCETYAKSVSTVLCSQEFRLAIHDAVVSIPEGQVSGTIQQLKTEISESLEWVKISFSVTAQNELGKLNPRSSKMYFDLQAELLGRCLSDMHTLVLDYLTVTAGNSNLIRVSVKDLMTVLRHTMNSLVAVEPDSVHEFLSRVTGRSFNNSGTGCKNDLLSTHWVLLFFFRLYMSCRSLYRQALSLVPPDTSRKMSEVMGDSVTAYSGKDWVERTDWTSGGYFSWILQPSASLFTIIQSVSDIYLKETTADCAPLVYVLNIMAVQRLVDLNRLIMSFEYLLQRKEYLVKTMLMDDVGSASHCKNNKKLKKCLSCLRQEAADLTNFMMGHLPLLAKDKMSIPSSDDAIYESIDALSMCEYDKWDFGVGALNEKSLPSALCWIIFQSIDVWCTHAAKKKLKIFLSLLIQNSLLGVRGSLDDLTKQNTNERGQLKNVTARQISLAVIRDTVLYEQRFVRRLMASRFCRILEKSILAIFTNAGQADLKSSPNSPEFLSVPGNSSLVSGNKLGVNGCTLVAELISGSSKRLPMNGCEEQNYFLSHSVEFTDCHTLLNFLCWMPKGYANSKSLALYATYILNIERLVVGSILECQDAFYLQNLHDLFRLLLSCRRALKNLFIASCEEKMGTSQSDLPLILYQSSFPVLWLLKSLSFVIVTQHADSENSSTPVKNLTFSLIDHTSYMYLITSKHQCIQSVRFLLNVEKPGEEQNNCAVVHEESSFDDSDPSSNSSKDIDAWKVVVLVAETLKEQTKNLLVSHKESCSNAKVRVPLRVLELLNLSAIISCSQGFMWGLASALDHVDLKSCNVKTKLSRRKYKHMDKLLLCIDVFAEFVNYFVCALLIEEDQLPGSFCDGQNIPVLDHGYDLLGVVESSCQGSHDKSVRKKGVRAENADCVDSILAKCDSFDLCSLKKSSLQGFLRGENPEAAYFLRQIFMASSALLRLNLQIKWTLSFSSVPILFGVSYVLLVELASKVEVPLPFSFVWLDGIAKFLEELGSYLPIANPILSRNLYVKMVELHLMAIGKCIALQGKRASLASHDTESSTKTLDGDMGLSESLLSGGPYYLDEFKTRLRMSFKVFVKKPSELHLLAAIQALERALVGVRVGCTINYEICTGSSDGGNVSSIVAAGIDCLDLVLEFVTGGKRSSVVKRHIQSLVACLFNIILHLQGPLIFYANLISNKGNADPDPGSVILMCVEVLTRVFGKHAMYQLDSCQVGQALRIPAAIFQNLFQLRVSEGSAVPHSMSLLDNQGTEIVGGVNTCVVDRQFLIDLFAACCRLLSTVLKHHKSETEQCFALLEDSVSVLLHCLEMVDTAEVVRKNCFAWEILEAVKCASFLRRIYEEMRQQKDVFGRSCSLFLSDYIWTYSGFGPLKTGIRREIDEALRPGVYALIDACSADDLQRLHTLFGEGPCRSTLTALQHDYKLNFQYEGKV
ncbi:4-hydroxythreonine-4-phosphate dehydrogenase [Actinidia chinensis var. chinensis]|uniref:4-hydroxythreonine-4-phosphate dehydrogenase n=1 Tax=Actinidia chinensis var. chinensis TaxID=1590841 RepID=A0A2R6R6R9_ACTCC|nr:4-hydroxythreonine-4-phosphate dehydrogenase [Actinidia chinensis var. chinensis]